MKSATVDVVPSSNTWASDVFRVMLLMVAAKGDAGEAAGGDSGDVRGGRMVDESLDGRVEGALDSAWPVRNVLVDRGVLDSGEPRGGGTVQRDNRERRSTPADTPHTAHNRTAVNAPPWLLDSEPDTVEEDAEVLLASCENVALTTVRRGEE